MLVFIKYVFVYRLFLLKLVFFEFYFLNFVLERNREFDVLSRKFGKRENIWIF